jgi:hypothetical protein
MPGGIKIKNCKVPKLSEEKMNKRKRQARGVR